MIRLALIVCACLLTSAALAQTPPAAPSMPGSPTTAGAAPVAAANAEVYLISPRDGEKLKGPVTVRFGLKGMGIAPAGIKFDNTGHHHLLVDTDLADIVLDQPMPATDKILHFGKGQTETVLTLPPGKHTLELLFADYTHRSFEPPVHSQKITITVE
jgi:hypothetical protein